MSFRLSALIGTLLLAASAASHAQNLAIVNGKPLPKARFDAVMASMKERAAQMGQPLPTGMEEQVRQKLIGDAVMVQVAEQRGLHRTPEYRQQMEGARSMILSGLLAEQYRKQNPVSGAAAKAEYDKIVAGLDPAAKEQVPPFEQVKQQVKDDLAEQQVGKLEAELSAKNVTPVQAAVQRGLQLTPEYRNQMDGAHGMVLMGLLFQQYGKQHPVSDADAKAEYDRIVAGMGPAAHGQVPPFEQVKQEVKDGMVEQHMVKLQDELRAKARIH